MKIQNTIVWHEFGHIFGQALASKITKIERKITCICLMYGKKSTPNILPEDNLGIYRKENWNNRIDHLKRKEVFIAYSLSKIMGAVFHVSVFKDIEGVTTNDFEKCFTNTPNQPLDNNQLLGHAGCDYLSYISLCQDSPYSYDNLYMFCFNLTKCFKRNNLFDNIEVIVKDFKNEFIGKNINGIDLFAGKITEIKVLINDIILSEVKGIIDDSIVMDNMDSNKSAIIARIDNKDKVLFDSDWDLLKKSIGEFYIGEILLCDEEKFCGKIVYYKGKLQINILHEPFSSEKNKFLLIEEFIQLLEKVECKRVES